MIHYLFCELPKLKTDVSLNFFCEKHGKNSRDQHFSAVSHFIERESFVKRLTSSSDICNAIKNQQDIAYRENERINMLRKKPEAKIFKIVQTKAFVVPYRTSDPVYNNFRTIPNFY